MEIVKVSSDCIQEHSKNIIFYHYLCLDWIQSCFYEKGLVYFPGSKCGFINFILFFLKEENYSAFKYETEVSSYRHFCMN